MAFLDIFKKKKKENVGGMEDFMTKRVGCQSWYIQLVSLARSTHLQTHIARSYRQQQVGRRREKSMCQNAARPVWHQRRLLQRD